MLAALAPVVLVPPLRAPPGTPRLAIALGSGSLHGVAHIGVQRGCAKLGIEPDLIAGTSSGAAVGALPAGGLDWRSISEIAREVDFGSASLLALPWRGLMSNEPLAETVDRALGGRRIEQLPTRFLVAATELSSGAPIVRARGPAGRAVAAPTAIPVLYTPVRISAES